MKTASDTITLNEFTKTSGGQNADVRLRIYKDTLNQPNKPTASSAVPYGWTSVAPSSVSTKLWMSIGVQTVGQGSYVWSNAVDITGRNGVAGQNGSNGIAGTRGNGFFSKSITLGSGVSVPTITSSQYNLDSREIICEDMGGTWSGSCNITLGNPVVGDLVSITYFDSNSANPTNRSGLYTGSAWETFALQIDGSLLVGGTVVADSLVSNLIVTNQIKGNNKTSTGGDTGLSGFYIDGTAGEMAVGDGTTDMRFVDGSLKIPATALVSPDGTATPSDVAVYMKGDDANKFTLQVAGGKGFRSVPETLDFTGHTVEYPSATPPYSMLTLPIAEVTPNSFYAVTIDNINGISQSWDFTIFLDSDYKGFKHVATCNSGSGWDGHWFEVYKVNSNTQVAFKCTAKHRGYNSGPEVHFNVINLKRIF